MMQGIEYEINDKYNIDIKEENIFKFYKIKKEEENLSKEQLEKKIEEAHQRWEDSINGANEKFAERDRKRLEKAETYEEILRNEKLRKKLYNYYFPNNQSETAEKTDIESLAFARAYFSLVATTRRIRKKDMEFFFEYFSEEKKKRKAIKEMLEKEFQCKFINDKKKEKEEEEESDKKSIIKTVNKGDDTLLVNLFTKDTIIGINEANKLLMEATKSEEVCKRYPNVNAGLSEFLEVQKSQNAKEFGEEIERKQKEAYEIRQEKGSEYIPLLDFYNLMVEISKSKDIIDNFSEFGLLLKYPVLTPYMFSFAEMKPETLQGIVEIAEKEGYFINSVDFILNYYLKIRDNFGISDSKISSILKEAENKTGQNKVIEFINKNFGVTPKKSSLPVMVEVVHGLLYWPIYLLYILFEMVKLICTNLRNLYIPIGILMAITVQYCECSVLRGTLMIISGKAADDFDQILISTGIIAVMIASVCTLLYMMAGDMKKIYDWKGMERTITNIFTKLHTKTKNDYEKSKNQFFTKHIFKIGANLGSMALFIGILYLVFFRG